jgi:hypothetical protein
MAQTSVRAEFSQELWESSLSEFENHFAPVVRQHGAELKIERLWQSDADGGRCSRSQDGKLWNLHIYGEMARAKGTTTDSFAILLCHELGHHLAGYPFYSQYHYEWAAAEGQAEYWAAQACLRDLWSATPEVNSHFLQVDAPQCDAAFDTTPERLICRRTLKAIESWARYQVKKGGRVPSPERPDPTRVKELKVAHPAAQCRIDSLVQGMLCTRSFDFSLIPGRLHRMGQNSIGAENEARATSCFAEDGFKQGARPACWFKKSTTELAPPPGPNDDWRAKPVPGPGSGYSSQETMPIVLTKEVP